MAAVQGTERPNSQSWARRETVVAVAPGKVAGARNLHVDFHFRDGGGQPLGGSRKELVMAARIEKAVWEKKRAAEAAL